MGGIRKLVGVVLAAGLAGCAHYPLGGRTAYDDAAVTTAVKARFALDPATSAMNLAVSTNGGKVQLAGVVDSREQSDRAARLARSAAGVKVVDNQISIQPRS